MPELPSNVQAVQTHQGTVEAAVFIAVLPWLSHSQHIVAQSLSRVGDVPTGSSCQPAAVTSPANSPAYSPRLHRQFPPLKCQWINEHAGDLVREPGSVLHRAGEAAGVGPHVPGHGVLEVPGLRGTLPPAWGVSASPRVCTRL